MHFFPPRGLIRVDVCDFGPDRAEHFEVQLGEIENGKPPFNSPFLRFIDAQ